MSASPQSLRIAITADLHYGTRHTVGNVATLELVAHLVAHPPDLLILAGDIGAGDDFARCLDLFAPLPCWKALIPGNHDIWVASADSRGDSYHVYRQRLPQLADERGFHFLDGGSLVMPEHGLAIAGSMNWYDYSWSIDELRKATPDWDERLRTKRFLRGRHNDANFVRWLFSDAAFTAEVVDALVSHLDEASVKAERAIVVTHHPAFRGLNYPAREPLGIDDLLWKAFSGNARLEEALVQRADRIAFVFSGHTHRAREGTLAGIRGYNIGGDYHFKRLLELDWPAGTVRAVSFGDE